MMNQADAIKPNFFIIGAPKCGTTALSEYLNNHPDVLLSHPKEPKYFHTDFDSSHRLAHSEEEYLACFGEELGSTAAVGEATVWYLYSRVAVRNILQFNPHAQFLVMVRNPVDLCHSLHSQLLFGGDEDVENFETAWRLQAARTEERSVPRFCRDARSLQYSEIASLGRQLERLYSQVPRERVLVIVYDDFKADPNQAYLDALTFLGLDPFPLTEVSVVNANRQVTLRPIASTLRLLGYVKRRLGIRGSLGIWKLATPLISRHRVRNPLSPELRRELVDFFSDDIDKLAELLDRDLSSWKI